MAKQSKTTFHTLQPLHATKILANIRAAGMSAPRAMILAAVRDGTAKYGTVYIGEVHAMYCSIAAKMGDAKPYTYAGVGSMLRSLALEGTIHKEKDGGYVTYKVTNLGTVTLRNMGV